MCTRADLKETRLKKKGKSKVANTATFLMLKCTALLRRNLKSITKPLLKNLENNKLNTRELEENK